MSAKQKSVTATVKPKKTYMLIGTIKMEIGGYEVEATSEEEAKEIGVDLVLADIQHIAANAYDALVNIDQAEPKDGVYDDDE